jgi:SAM-dependent methyltransferase
MYVGAGTGAEGWVRQLAQWQVPDVTLVEAEEAVLGYLHQVARTCKGWRVMNHIVAERAGAVEYYRASNRAESGLVDPEKMQSVWANSRRLGRTKREALRVSDLVREETCPDSWLVVDCLPAAPIVAGARDLIEHADVIVARVVLKESILVGESAGLEDLDQLLREYGFRRVVIEPERHPALGHVLFVKDLQEVARRLRSEARQLRYRIEDARGAVERLGVESRQQIDELEAELNRVRLEMTERTVAAEELARERQQQAEDLALKLAEAHDGADKLKAEHQAHMVQLESLLEQATATKEEQSRLVERLTKEVEEAVRAKVLAEERCMECKRDLESLGLALDQAQAESKGCMEREASQQVETVASERLGECVVERADAGAFDAEQRTLSASVDRMDMSVIVGWARYLESEEAVEIELVVNDHAVGTFRADEYRPDLERIRSDGSFGFRIDLGLAKGSMRRFVPRNARVFLRDTRTGGILPHSHRVFHGLAPEDQHEICDGEGRLFRLNKGLFKVPVEERSPDWRHNILQAAQELTSAAASGGFALAAAYGTLLGAVRESAMIPHDDDVDLMFISGSTTMLGAVVELRSLENFLRKQGHHVEELTNGQIHVSVGDSNDLVIDVFLGWFEGGRFNLTFTVHRGPGQEDILPLSTVVLDGVELPSPNKPELLLEAIYGPNWRTPDPSFRWKRSSTTSSYFAPIHNYKRMANVDYWKRYYSNQARVGLPCPSQFAAFVMGLPRRPTQMLDLGCGSGRDALFFASQGLQVIGLDYAEPAISEAKSRAVEMGLATRAAFLKCDVSNLHEMQEVLAYAGSKCAGGSRCVYSRFFIHAIDENAEGAALLLVRELLVDAHDFAVFEFRTTHDRARQKIAPKHYRRYVDVDRFIARACDPYSLTCTYRTEGLGYAVLGADDAHVARLIFERLG